MRSRRFVLAGVATAVVVGVGVVLVWFQPQTLLYDTVVEDDFPAAPPPQDPTPPDDGAAEPAAPVARPDDPDAPAEAQEAGPVALSTGSFSSRNRYTVEGDATVYETEDGSRTLRLEPFSSTNGPDLFVYLTAGDAADPDAELDTDFVDLGTLRGNVGNQNYDIPSDVDLDRYDTVVIWCRRFTVGFGAADLRPRG